MVKAIALLDRTGNCIAQIKIRQRIKDLVE